MSICSKFSISRLGSSSGEHGDHVRRTAWFGAEIYKPSRPCRRVARPGQVFYTVRRAGAASVWQSTGGMQQGSIWAMAVCGARLEPELDASEALARAGCWRIRFEALAETDQPGSAPASARCVRRLRSAQAITVRARAAATRRPRRTSGAVQGTARPPKHLRELYAMQRCELTAPEATRGAASSSGRHARRPSGGTDDHIHSKLAHEPRVGTLRPARYSSGTSSTSSCCWPASAPWSVLAREFDYARDTETGRLSTTTCSAAPPSRPRCARPPSTSSSSPR